MRGPVAVDDPGEGGAEQSGGHVGGPAGAAGEKGEGRRDEGPDPGLGLAFLGRRLVGVQDGLLGEASGQRVVGRLHGVGRAVLQGHHPAATGGLLQDQAQEGGGPTFRLAEAGHEQGTEGDQPRPGLAGGDADGQVAAGGDAAAANEPVALVFGDGRPDLRQLPDLMAEGLGVGSGQGPAAATAGRRHTRHDLAALFDGDQRPLVFGVPGLSPGRPPRLGPRPRRLGVRVLGRRRFGRVGRVFAELRFEFGDARLKLLDIGVQLFDVGADGGRGPLEERFRRSRHPVHDQQRNQSAHSRQVNP